MSYLTQSVIARNTSMHERMAQAAAREGYGSPDAWASSQSRAWAASPGWDAAWESALASHPDDPDFDPGADEAVITDGMILAEVQAVGPDQPGA